MHPSLFHLHCQCHLNCRYHNSIKRKGKGEDNCQRLYSNCHHQEKGNKEWYSHNELHNIATIVTTIILIRNKVDRWYNEFHNPCYQTFVTKNDERRDENEMTFMIMSLLLYPSLLIISKKKVRWTETMKFSTILATNLLMEKKFLMRSEHFLIIIDTSGHPLAISST